MTPQRLVEIRSLILSVKQDSVRMGDTRIRLLVVDPDALVRAMDDLLAEVERLSAFEAGMKLAWKERFEWKTTFTSEDEAE